jgi:hypothetical protein
MKLGPPTIRNRAAPLAEIADIAALKQAFRDGLTSMP